jgi:hypothetical protein
MSVNNSSFLNNGEVIEVDIIIRNGHLEDLAPEDLDAPRVIYLTDVRRFIVSRGDGTYEDISGEIKSIDELVQAIQVALGGKASTESVEGLNARIGNIIAQSGTSDTEVVDARAGADGHVYNTLKDRLDSEHRSTAQDIKDVEDSVSELAEEVETKYKKPEKGIPESDLTGEVSKKLAKAEGSVSFEEQMLTEEQKKTVRENIDLDLPDSPLTNNVKDDSKVLILQSEEVNENEEVLVEKATLTALVAALRRNGVNSGYQTIADLEEMFPDLVRSVKSIPDGIRVTYWDGAYEDIEIKSGGLAFDSIFYDQQTGYFHILMGDEDVVDPTYIGGGGGGGASGSVITITNRMSSRAITITNSATSLEMLFNAISVDANTSEPTGNLSLAWYVNGTRVALQAGVAQGNGSFECRQYLTAGAANTVKLMVEDTYGTSKSMQWTVTVTAYTLSWNIQDFGNHGESAFNIRVVPNGQGDKTLKVSVDGGLIYNEVVSTSGRAVAVTVPAQDHGAHTVLAWLEISVDGETIQTTPLRHVGIWVESGVNTPIVAIFGSELVATRYETLSIKYRVYDPLNEITTIRRNATGESEVQLNVNRETQVWAYRPTTAGEKTISITCGEVSDVASVQVSETQYDIHPVTRGLIKDLDPTGHSNEEADARSFGYKDGEGVNHPLTFSENFDWVSGGFQRDEAGVTALLVKRGTYVEFDRSMFNDEAKNSGKEIKVIFKVAECRDYDATCFTCYANNIGLRLQAQQAVLSSALQTATVQYCEEEKIEMDINIESTAEDQLAVIWLKGVPSRGVAYSESDSWQQTTPQRVKIGSADCDVWVYRVKMYGTSLTKFEVLDNFTADCSDIVEMIDRYERNDIFNTNGTINETLLAEARPELRVIHIKAEKMTVSKSDEVLCDVTLKYVNGGDEYEFVAQRVTMKAQGTSSLEYILAALNLDLDFKNATLWENGKNVPITKYAMTPNSIPVNYLNIKLNVASSESANNAMGVDDYNEFQPYIVAQRKQNPKVRDTCEGHPCAIFFENTKNEPIEVGARVVGAGETILYGCGDIINSKKNYDVFGQNTTEYPYQCCIEITNNNNLQTRFKSDDLSDENWGVSDVGVNNFGFRYPKSPTSENKADWQRVLSWVYSTDRTAATGNTLPQSVVYDGVTYTTDTESYRAAKFKAELADYFAVGSLLYHYLMTETKCMVDSRAKNTFLSFEVENYKDREDKSKYRWNICKNYDNDTMQGNDNSGGLTFTYGLEDTDVVGGQNVFNAADSVLWVNIRDLFVSELKTMFLDREAAGAWSASRILSKWKNHQSARPEALCVEDMWGKYFTPFINRGETKYIDMMLGTKEYQRQQFQTYQEKYMSSKYSGSVSTVDRINLRPQTSEADASGDLMGIVPYADCYITVKYGEAYTARIRAKRGHSYDITVPGGTSVSDLETYIYSSSMLKAVGTLEKLYSKKAEMAFAIKLQEAIIGSGDEGYENVSLTTISLGNNKLLEVIDLRGTPNLVQELDLSPLKALEEIYTTGSGVTGIRFAQRSPLKVARLNALRQLIVRDLTELETFNMTYENLQTVWVDNCPIIDTKTLVESATGLSRGRIIGVDWDLNDASLLLRLSVLVGIDAQGGNIERFVLTGNAHVAITSSSALSTLNSVFPDLEITYDELLPDFTVRFLYYNGTVLDTQRVSQGSAPTNPVTRQHNPIPTPTRESTAALNYTFDGWSWTSGGTVIPDITRVSIIADTDFYAHYTEDTRSYRVRWFNGTSLLNIATVDYGESAEFVGEYPKHPSDGQYAKYYLFKGWDKSTTVVTQNIDVYAQYDSTTPPSGKTLSQMSPEELYALIKTEVLSSTGENNNVISSGDTFDLVLGNDFNFSNVESHELVSLVDPKTFNGTDQYYIPEVDGDPVKLFDEDKSFTLVCDFKFSAMTSGAVLMSAYEGNGFILRSDGTNPSVRYGGSSAAQVGAEKGRDIIVVRHIKGEPNLRVYASRSAVDTMPTTSVQESTLTQLTVPVTEAPLTFGCRVSADGYKDNYAAGTIYWAKVWMDDLGDAACRLLSAWPRETCTMQASGTTEHAFRSYRRADNDRYPNCMFFMKNLMDLTRKMNQSNTNSGGWNPTSFRSWLANRIYPAMPIKFKQLILTMKIYSTKGGASSEMAPEPSLDKLFIPCCKDVGLNTTGAGYSQESDGVVNLYTNDASRIKKLGNGTGAASDWWLRSPLASLTDLFWFVTASGRGASYYYDTGYGANVSYGVAFGFCI